MANIVVNGRGILPTVQTQAEVEDQLQRQGAMSEDPPPHGFIRLMPSRTLVNVAHIVTISDTE